LEEKELQCDTSSSAKSLGMLKGQRIGISEEYRYSLIEATGKDCTTKLSNLRIKDKTHVNREDT
jgi:hypothetical protein